MATTGTIQDSHGSPGGETVFPPFDGASFASQLLWLAIAFGALWLLMGKVALPRVERLLKERRDKITGDLDEAQRLKLESEAAAASYDRALAEARRGAQKLADDARAEVTGAFDAKKSEAEAELAKKLADAEARIAEVKERAMSEVGSIARETAEAILERLTGAPAKGDVQAAVAEALKR